MKTITYKGKLAMGLQDELNLKTNNGLTGYKITKFQIMSTAPGTVEHEYVAKIFNTDQTGSISAVIDFSDNNLLAAIISFSRQSALNSVTEQIIIDKNAFNQNIFITIADASGSTVECNYYIELEAFPISEVEATKLTLQSIRTVTE
jgi:hypothetical protein